MYGVEVVEVTGVIKLKGKAGRQKGIMQHLEEEVLDVCMSLEGMYDHA